MGRGTAVRFAGEGASVVIADLNQEGGEAVVRECKENGGNAVFQKTDVSSEEQIKAAIDRAVSEFGRLDITFNNAGIGGALGPLDKSLPRLGSDLRDSAAFGFLWYQVFYRAGDAQGRRRVNYFDGFSRGPARRRRAGRLQRGQGGRGPSDQVRGD